jgi:hypothetical protein
MQQYIIGFVKLGWTRPGKVVPLCCTVYCILPVVRPKRQIHLVAKIIDIDWLSSGHQTINTLKPHCIRCSHFKVDDVSALEPSSKPPVCIVEDNVAASLHQQRTP